MKKEYGILCIKKICRIHNRRIQPIKGCLVLGLIPRQPKTRLDENYKVCRVARKYSVKAVLYA